MEPVCSKEDLLEMVRRSLDSLNPFNAVRKHVSFDSGSGMIRLPGGRLTIEDGQTIWVLGIGKASAEMGRAMESIFEARIQDGIVITPGGVPSGLNVIHALEGSHPVPDKASMAATYELIHLAERIPEAGLVFFLLSGGTSSLLCMPAANLEIEEVASMHRLLLKSGANIYEMNVVRSVCSAVKGGQLLRYLKQCKLVDLVISDVPGNDFRTIGSGPTSAGSLDYKGAFKILNRYGLWADLPQNIRHHISRGIKETGNQTVEAHPGEHKQYLIASAEKLAEDLAGQFREKGFDTHIEESAYNLPITKLEERITGKLNAGRSTRQPGKTCYIFYGESTVHVTGGGKGGRNQEIALRIARHIKQGDPVLFASIATDGVDGPTDAAGAIVDAEVCLSAKQKGLDPEQFLADNNSYHFFRQAGGLIKTGPTGNNLMDIQVLVFG